jgi:hypothetical protein
MVPVGDDQLPMIEQTNETGPPLQQHRRPRQVLVECKAVLSAVDAAAWHRRQGEDEQVAGELDQRSARRPDEINKPRSR